MKRLLAFARLDFLTIKPYFTVMTVLIYVVVALFLTTFSGNISTAMGVGMMLGTLFLGYPFALGEKSSMDVLYATLALKRGTVVSGRYLFALLLNACAVLFSVALGAVGLFAARELGVAVEADGAIETVIALSALFIFVQAIQLPLYFKLGYSKAKFLSLLPFVVIMVGFFLLLILQNSGSIPAGFMVSALSGEAVALFLLVAVVLVVCASYFLSRAFYERREF